MLQQGMSDTDPLITYLATHDAPCPGCGYNLRGLRSGVCPECGKQLTLDMFHESPPRPFSWVTDVWAFFLALPFIMGAAVIAGLGVTNGMADAWPIAGGLILAFLLLACFFLFPVRRLLRRKPHWILLYNPVTFLILLYCIFVLASLVIG